MYNITEAQKIAEKSLNKQGFKFSNWIANSPEDTEKNLGCMVFKRQPRKCTTEYREVSPEGYIN